MNMTCLSGLFPLRIVEYTYCVILYDNTLLKFMQSKINTWVWDCKFDTSLIWLGISTPARVTQLVFVSKNGRELGEGHKQYNEENKILLLGFHLAYNQCFVFPFSLPTVALCMKPFVFHVHFTDVCVFAVYLKLFCSHCFREYKSST